MSDPREIVVIGHGMVGSRFVTECRARDPEGQRVRITVVGAESRGPYNRILLSDAVNGRLEESELALPSTTHANDRVCTGRAVTAVDPQSRRVYLDDGTELRYDELVLATGAQPAFPPVRGLVDRQGAPSDGVTALRDLDDCARVRSWARSGAPLVVLGGGVLGLEAARGLNEAGSRVAVVESAPWLMRRQLDRSGADILAQQLRTLGIDIHTWRVAGRWVPGTGLELDDGRMVPADGIIVTAGVRARTELATAAGLATEHGVLVDDRLATSAPRVHAIGDCAQHSGGGAGLVAPGWEMARILADQLTGVDPAARYRGARAVTRLKAAGIELTALGDAEADAGEQADVTETVTVADPHGGRYGKLSVRSGHIVGAVLLGFADAAAAISQLYTEDGVVPADRLSLLLGLSPTDSSPASSGESDPTVCHCNAVRRSDLESAWLDGARSRAALAERTRATTGCGGCTRDVDALVTALGDGAEPVSH
ncbi:FAD-dependent oxidoreductase [Lipingzhangella sp. LS1_29]|uniref:FAD-dependent oxidoreductase n=1 Tax=Lipingzhangella rawalii TaxID=2055835 RepID=A0ABU2H7R8_9ACTN|nr:FAD-dependent oxidoreductase [Lipingzhangella rawalii]MDS1270860.1 FAD-dependent oxidoreductase [Lipingzhangella rawalii]